MFSLPYISICTYCILQLIFMIVMEMQRRYIRDEQRCFLWMLIIVLLSFAANILSSIYVRTGFLSYVTAAGNYVEFILNTLLVPLFFYFVSGQIGSLTPAQTHKWKLFFWTATVICAGIVLSTAFTGKIFFFDEANRYHRGPLFMLPMTIQLLMMAAMEGFLISQRRKIAVGYYRSMTFFIFAPLAGWALQSMIYGLPFALLGITFAAHVVFANVQNRNIDVDYLTGAFNRKALDRYLRRRIDAAAHAGCFSAILLDVDNFKCINDRLGHFEGDVALINAVRILRGATEHADFVARYGGDEFLVILEDERPESVIRAIEARLAAQPEGSGRYRLSFSMGCAAYEPQSGDTAESFLLLLDRRMYDEKRRKANLSHAQMEGMEA